MPIRDPNDAAEVEAGIARVFGAPPEERASAIRQLFVEVLDFNPDRGEVSLAGAPAGVELPETADRLATLDGVSVLHVALQAPATGRVRKADVTAAARIIAEQFGDDLLLVLTNAGASQLHFVRPDLGDARPRLRRMIVERDLPQRTAVEQIAGIYWKRQETRSLPTALDRAFDVEPVTKDFFKEYKRVFRQAEESVSGFADEEGADKRLFVQTLFNRLMFIYFLQRKGWLDFRGDKDYLRALWDDYRRNRRENDDFYFTRLTTLFFVGLNNPDSRDLTAGTAPLIGSVPFLNGGLFERGDLDKRKGLTVPDEAIEPVLTDLFERFNFTVMESTPFDIEVAVDPEMLGKVFEELVTGRQESGSYYTPRDVVSYMCREALKGYLEVRGTGLPPAVIAAFVDEHRTAGIDVAAARKVAAALDEVTVVDPACGSGAYLLGMMQELVELQTVLFNAGADDKSLHTLKLEIIERNLRGVDIDPFAIHIAQLRLWLSLTIEYDGPPPVPPLPNLDLGIVTGDSLLVAHLSARDLAEGGVQGAFIDQAAELQELKARYMRESAGPAKAALRARIDEVNRGLRESYGGSAAPDAGGGVDWRSAFSEVFEPRDGRGGGFDIVIANPPYHQLQRDGGRLADLYRDVRYRTFVARGDIYQLFYERGCELLKPDGGVLAYITSNSWLRAEYGKKLRAFFAGRHTPLRWLDLGKDVFESAIVDSGVLLLRTGGGEVDAFPAVDMDRLPGIDFPPPEGDWGRIMPDGDGPWSTLSITEHSVMAKMRSRGVPLAEWDAVIKMGVITGYNEAFIIDGATRDALIADDPRSDEIIKPILRGRDIRRWRAEWAGKWIILAKFGSHEYLASDYPAVHEHLTRHEERLRNRGQVRYTRSRGKGRSTGYPGQHHWLELDNSPTDDFLGLFAKPKLFWMDMSPEGRFAYSEDTTFCNDKGFILVGPSLKYLCAVLNSSLVMWMIRHTALTTGLGLTQWKKFTVERIPIPPIGEEEQRPLVELVDRILEAKAVDAGAETEEWERAIDRLVYNLYGLIEEEDTAVERTLGLIHPTEEAEDAAILQKMLERAGDAGDSVSRDTVMAALRASSGA
ncbi:MAG: class I SAM-dependent DNA methyltransferase [Dehalococcoidia bacterium]|nr:class I SAM-dependent DNA methyltransferase [Gemmatimonadota bacterium]MYI85629.1 class I SAM-dependent DNA methyltransferase [Dehalococcoidia bacterium]